MVTRTQVAAYVADTLPSNREAAMRNAAAWLVDSNRAHEVRYLVRDVERELANRGYVFLRVATARPLESAAKDEIIDFVKHKTGATQVELVESVDASLIGGVRIEVPDGELDSTVRMKLAKFVEGVSL
jgi:F0F1-type ATP synthase delta subunit